MPKKPSEESFLPRQIEVLDKLSLLGSVELAADALFISKNTAQTHVNNANSRHGFTSAIQSFRKAVEDGHIKLTIKNRDDENS